MQYLAVFLLATGGSWYGAYWLGRRSDAWSVVLAPLLMLAAWPVLVDLTRIPRGEGVAVGVAVFEGAVWYVGGMCVLLALILLGTSVYLRRSGVATAVLLCVLATVLVLGYRLRTDRDAGPKESAASSKGAVEPRDSSLEGYAWALDNNIDTDAECVNGKPAFIDGCKRAVRRRHEMARPPAQGR
jgi:hypothetical protein